MTTMTKQALWTRLTSALVALCCTVLIAVPLQADQVMEQDVVAAAETWLRHVIGDARPDAVIEYIEPHVFEGRTVGYIAHLVDGGYCLCGADDLVLPVYLYCPQGTYDPDNPSNRYILWEIGARLANLRTALGKNDPQMQRYEAALAERAALWQDLIARRIPERQGGKDGRSDPDMMVLALTCTWDQRAPYNDQCPELSPGSGFHTIVGCVATAMCQIMYYWQWPDTGTGWHSHEYYYRWRSDWDSEPCANDPDIPADPFWDSRLVWQATGGGQLLMNGDWDHSLYGAARGISDTLGYRPALEALYDRLIQEVTNHGANFGATTYDWSVIQDAHAAPPDPGDEEVAKLCYHASIAVDMIWGVWLSLAATGTVATALEDYFRYDPDAWYDVRDIDVMTEEIQWLRPLEIRGTDPAAGGHAWVVYGYDKSTDPDRLFMMNMGWGWGDGWYSCDNVCPGGYHLNVDQAHVTDIAPAEVVGFVGGAHTGDGSPDNPYWDIQDALIQAPDGAALLFKAGSVNTFSGGLLRIDRPMTLKGYDITIQPE